MLVEDADLTRELGLDVEALIGSNDQLVHARITGWGPEGPMADLPGAEIAGADGCRSDDFPRVR